MDRCPIELLCYIFAEACTDDGQTGRALSLVSKRVRNASRRHALQSVALYGSEQISAFAAHLDKLDPQERRVRNLYLTDRRRVWMEYGSGKDRAEWLKERIAEDFHVTDPSRQYSSDAILSIFRHIAPTLRICTLLFFDRYHERSLEMPFVALRELTLYGSVFNYHGYLGPDIPLCPKLERLHVIQDFTMRGSLVRGVSRISPILTHLRISRLVPNSLGAADIVQGLEQMLQKDPKSCERGGFPQTLKRIIVQMSQQELIDSHGILSTFASPMAQQLKDIAMRDTAKRVVLLKPHLWNPADSFAVRDTDVEYYMGIKAHWEKSLLGLEGIWGFDEAEVLAAYGHSSECSKEITPVPMNVKCGF